jgi:hypothetical protein
MALNSFVKNMTNSSYQLANDIAGTTLTDKSIFMIAPNTIHPSSGAVRHQASLRILV